MFSLLVQMDPEFLFLHMVIALAGGHLSSALPHFSVKESCIQGMVLRGEISVI